MCITVESLLLLFWYILYKKNIDYNSRLNGRIPICQWQFLTGFWQFLTSHWLIKNCQKLSKTSQKLSLTDQKLSMTIQKLSKTVKNSHWQSLTKFFLSMTVFDSQWQPKKTVKWLSNDCQMIDNDCFLTSQRQKCLKNFFIIS